MDPSALPIHVGIIMDGNGRWAKKQGQPRTFGHTEGLKRAKEIAKAASDLGIRYLTLYVFSTENWKRTQEETGFLMGLIHSHIRQELDFYRENHIRVRLIGDRSGLPKQIQDDISQAERDTESFDGMSICLAINYGGRDEIIRAVRKIASEGVKPESINESDFPKFFDQPELPDADLIIRTGGEERLSNFLMWHSAYAELVFSDILWPDYDKRAFYDDIVRFQQRNRRYGAVPV
ncbi:MAG: di-trans,poly-cis-decaprenylcistransferase [Treponema sp.]|nr:di-trans,poly-cis-decaprenylcistransferase [Treponema sp.]